MYFNRQNYRMNYFIKEKTKWLVVNLVFFKHKP